MADRCVALAQDAVARGGRPLNGVLEAAHGGAMRPMAVDGCPRDCELVRGAHFGPVLAVVPVDGLQDALEMHRAVGQHLATSVYTGSPDAVLGDPALLAALGSSNVTINDSILPTAHPATAITGSGPSGWGPSRGAAGLLALTREVTVSSTSALVRTPLDEPEPRVQAWLRRLAIGRAGRAVAHGSADSPTNTLAAGHAAAKEH